MADAEDLAADMSPIDAAEMAALCPGGASVAAIRRSIAMSEEAVAVRDAAGRLVLIGGHAPGCPFSDDGIVWMLTTAEAPHHGRQIVAKTSTVCDALLGRYRTLWNVILERNALVKRWLRHCGFEIGPAFDLKGRRVQIVARSRDV